MTSSQFHRTRHATPNKIGHPTDRGSVYIVVTSDAGWHLEPSSTYWLRAPDLNLRQSVPSPELAGPQVPRQVGASRQPARLLRTRRPPEPENVGSRLLSLLQSAPDQTLSAIFGTAKKPNCRRHSRVRLGGLRAERYGKSLSECRFVSEAWGLAHLLYKLFSLTFQCLSLIA